MAFIITLLLILFVIFFQFIAVPYCLMIVLGLFGITVGFLPCLAVVVIFRAIVFLIRGN